MQKSTVAAIIFALSFFGLFVLAFPQYDSVTIFKEAVDLRQAALSQRSAQLSKMRELEGQIVARQADINKIKSFLPERKQIDEIVSSLEDITKSSGLQILGMTTAVAPSIDETGYKKLLVTIDLIGRYPAFIDFLKLLEQSLRLYDIFEINAATSTVVEGNINFSVKINAYYLK